MGAYMDGSSKFVGHIREVRVYNRALGDDEIAALFQQACGSVTTPARETCDGVYNDCDGVADNGLPEGTAGRT